MALIQLSHAAYTRMMKALLPPAPWAPDGIVHKVMQACSDELVRIGQRAADLVAESDPRQADELLPEYEATLNLPSTGTDDERRARVVAHLVRRQRYRPADFQAALASILGQAIEDVVVIEISRAEAIAMDDDREIYRFFIYRDPAEAGSYNLDDAQDVVQKMKPTVTKGHVIESVQLLCDDPFSLTDRDILGAATSPQFAQSLSQYAEGAAAPSLGLTNKLTLEAQVKVASDGGNMTIISQWGSSGSQSFIFRMVDGDRIELQITHDGSTVTLARANISSILDTWTHLAVTFDGAEATVADRFVFYVDGTPAAHSVITGTANAIHDGIEPIRTGAIAEGDDAFDGALADVRAWDVKRSAAEIAAGIAIGPESDHSDILAMYYQRASHHDDHSDAERDLTAVNAPTFAEDYP